MRALRPLGGLLFLLACAAPLAQAAAPATYSGEAPVTSQSDAERGEALKTALANVVIEVSGDSGVLARHDVAEAVGGAQRYVLQYQYRRDPGDAATPARLMLVAQFDRVAVDAMLARLGLGAEGAGSAAVPMVPTEASVWISGIESANDYARALAAFGTLDLVRKAEPVRARGDGMLVHLSLTTDLAHFLGALTAERSFSVVNGSPPVEGVDATLALAPQ